MVAILRYLLPVTWRHRLVDITLCCKWDLSSQSDRLWLLPTLSVCVSVCVCVSGPLLRLISRLLWVVFRSNLVGMLELRSDWLYWNLWAFCGKRKKPLIRGKFFFAFLCVSEQFESVETHFFLKILSIQWKRETIMLRQTVTLATAILSLEIIRNNWKAMF